MRSLRSRTSTAIPAFGKLVALRADPLAGVGTTDTPHPVGFRFAGDVVDALRKRFDC